MYAPYLEVVYNNLSKKKEELNFKNVYAYQGILEHVNLGQGKEYLKLIRDEFQLSDEKIRTYCNLNDSLGRPALERIENFLISPTSFRYLYHALLIVKYMRELGDGKRYDVVEIGGGYGGLCLALSYLDAPISSYKIYDLDPVYKLQAIYLANFDLKFPVETFSSENLNVHPGCFVVSNYAFSEFSEGIRRMFEEKILRDASHGFMVWNEIPFYEPLGGHSLIKNEVERPVTGEFNRFIYF